MVERLYDVIIVGAGPAGLAAALYAGRDRYSTLMLEKSFAPGGQILLTDRIENYPGFRRISGQELVENMKQQAMAFGAELLVRHEARRLGRHDDATLLVEVYDEAEDRLKQLRSRTVILSPGSDYRRLGVPGEQEFRSAGAGVSYCGTCDGPFFKDKTVVTIGGGNTAVQETMHVARFAARTYMIHRRDQFRAHKVLVEELLANKDQLNIELVLDSVVERIEGQDRVERVVGKNVKTDRPFTLACEGVFIFVGHVPNTRWLQGAVELTDQGLICCDPTYLRTRMPGVFVAGDCRIGAARQLATACGDGVTAAMMLKQYLADPAWWFRPAENT